MDKKSNAWKYYGGRGIGVCDRWMSFENFYEDMGDCPPGLSIDRIDNSKGYYKENCRWASRGEQANNTRRSRKIEFNGEVKTLSQWADLLQINYGTLQTRLDSGYEISVAFKRVRYSNAGRHKVAT